MSEKNEVFEENILKQLNEEQMNDVTKAKEIINHIDGIVIEYMDFMFDGIDRESVIYPMYRAVVNYTMNKMGKETPYRVAVQVASTLLFEILSDIQDREDAIEESMYNSYGEGEDDVEE